MPGTQSRGPSAKVTPSRLISPRKDEEEGFQRKSQPPSRIGSAVSVASTSNRSEKDAAGLITDLRNLKQITHDVRIPKKDLPHRVAIDPETELDDYLGVLDGQYLTEVRSGEGEDLSKPVSRKGKRGEEDEEEESDLEGFEDEFGDDVCVSSAEEESEDDEEKYDTDLEEETEEVVPSAQEETDRVGKSRYLQVCEEMGIQPATYYLKHMSDTELVMKFHGLGPRGMKAMAQSIEVNTLLEKIDLEGNFILGEGTTHLTRVLRDNLYVTELVLTENKMGNVGAKAICELLTENKTIIHLNLSGNEIDDAAAESFCDMLTQNTTIKTLMLRHNSFEERGAECFSQAINDNVTLETLDLSWNKFQARGCIMIVHALKENEGLKSFDFSMNGFGLEGARAMEEALKENKCLLKLNISYCRIPLEGAPHIAAGLQLNETLEDINLSFNPLTAEGGYAILVGVERNTYKALKMLNFGNLMVRKPFKELKDQLTDDRDIKVIYGGILSDQPLKKKKDDEDPLTKLLNDPMNKLKQYVEEAGYRMVDLLKSFDRDQSFTISLEELQEGIKKCGIDMSDPEILELMHRLDKDGNGEIDFSELLEGDNENRQARREVKKLQEEMQQKEAEKERLLQGADPKSFMTILESKS